MAKSNMLGLASSCSSSPKTERRRSQLTSHQLDDFARRKSKLGLDRVERRPVLPRHLDDPIAVVCGERHVCQSQRSCDLVRPQIFLGNAFSCARLRVAGITTRSVVQLIVSLYYLTRSSWRFNMHSPFSYSLPAVTPFQSSVRNGVSGRPLSANMLQIGFCAQA